MIEDSQEKAHVWNTEKLPGVAPSSLEKSKKADPDELYDVSDECELDSVDSSPDLQDKAEAWNPEFHKVSALSTISIIFHF